MATLADELRMKNGEGFVQIKEELENLLKQEVGNGKDLILDFDSYQKQGISHHQYISEWWTIPSILMPATLSYLEKEGFRVTRGPLYSEHNFRVYL